MTIDEKLDLLLKNQQEMQGDIAGIRTDITGLHGDIAEIRTDITGLHGDIAEMRTDITNIQLHLENVTDHNIQLLVENYIPAAKRFEKASSEIETMQDDISVLKKVVADHSEKLKKIS